MKIFNKKMMNYFLLGLTGFVLLGIGIHESHAVNQYVNKVSGEVSEEISSRSSHGVLLGEISADMVAWEPLPVTEFRIQSIERGIDEDDDKIILQTSINGTGERVNVIVRDKLEIIENVLRPGMIFEYTGSLINDARELRVDFTDTFRFLNEKGNIIIDRKIVTHDVDNQQIGLTVYGAGASLLTIKENPDDCMEGQFEVCHPTLLFQTYSGQEILEEEVPRGMPIDIFSNNERTVIVSDAHTYGEYRNDKNRDYARLEFLGIYLNGKVNKRMDYFNKRSDLSTHRFCASFFAFQSETESFDVDYTCTKKGERLIRQEKRKAFWKNLMLKIRGEKDDYVVC